MALIPVAPPRLDRTRHALFLDIDGTLAPIASRPDLVVADPRLTVLLKRLERRLEGALALVTGRTIADADRITDGACTVVAGVHGLTIRRGDGVEGQVSSQAVAAAVADATPFVEAMEGLLLEDKGLGLTIHFRGAPQRRDEVEAFGRALAVRTGLRAQAGDMVFELREPGADKGSAVEALMADRPFSGRQPVFVGDDLTDEDGFRAAQARGGWGVLVGDRSGSEADYRLGDPHAVLAWLEDFS